MAPDPDPTPTDAETARLFVEHVLAQGSADSIDALYSAHPERADELRSLHARWQGAVLGASLIERLRKRHGDDVELDVSLDGPLEGLDSEDGRRPSSSRAAGPSSSVYGHLSDRGDRSGRYRHEGEIARGGMGAILKVWDGDLRRTLAMKVALTSEAGASGKETSASDSRLLGRFLEEAQITGQLDHPGIVPVHELGLDAEGRVYFTMRLVKGRTLDEIFKEVHKGSEEWTLTRVVGVMQKICEAMAFAHEKNVVHRDLKPANIMVGRFGVTYVMDWGLARVLGREDSRDLRLADSGEALSIVRTDRADARTPESPLVTMDGDIVGTPCYMAPEQARGRIEDIGPHSDVYAAGSMLYDLLTGCMPYVPAGEKVSPGSVLRQLLAGPPTPIRELASDAPEELISICDKAMAREPGERYGTMLAMAEDLRAYLEDRVVAAHASGPVAEFRKWIRRNRAAAVAGAAAVLLAIAGLVTVVLVQAQANEDLLEASNVASRARDEAQGARDEALAAQVALESSNEDLAAARDEADSEARQARLSAYAASIAAASASLKLGNNFDVQSRLGLSDQELRGWEWSQLELAADPSVRDLTAEDGNSVAFALHPDGDRIALRRPDDLVEVFEIETGERLARFEVGAGNELVLAYSADGAELFAVDSEHVLAAWDPETGARSRELAVHEQAVMTFAVDPSGSWVATGTLDKIVRVWDAETGVLEHELEGHGSAIRCLAFDPRGQRLASGSRDQTVRVWDLARGSQLLELEGPEYPVAFVAFDPNGVRLAAGFTAFEQMATTRGANTVRVWDLPGGELASVLSGPRNRLSSGGFSPSGARVFASSEDASVWSWELVGGRDQVLLGHRTGLIGAAFTPDGEHVVSVSSSDRVKLWRPEMQLGFRLEGHFGRFTDLAFAPNDAGVLFSTSEDSTVRTWDTRSGLVTAVLRGHSLGIRELAVSADASLLGTASGDGTVRVWESRSGLELARLGEEGSSGFGQASEESAESVAMHPSGELLALAGPGELVRTWAWREPDGVRSLEGPAEGSRIGVVRFSPDGGLLLAAGRAADDSSCVMFLWDVESGELLDRRGDLDRSLRAVEFSPDGSLIALGMWGRIELHGVDEAERDSVRVLRGHDRSVDTVAFSPDGRRMASGSSDNSVLLWDLESDSSLYSLGASETDVIALDFAPDGRQLAVAYEDWHTFLWDTRPTAEREQAHDRLRDERRQVLGLLDDLFAAFPGPDEVVERLRSDPSLGSDRLSTAITLARLVGTDRRRNDRENWRSLRQPGSSEVDLHIALWSASIAVQQKADERALRLLGSSKYRLGRLEEAVATLEEANQMRRNRSRVDVLAFLAMAYHRLGQEEDSQAALADLRLLMQVPVNLVKRESQLLLSETEAVLRRQPDQR